MKPHQVYISRSRCLRFSSAHYVTVTCPFVYVFSGCMGGSLSLSVCLCLCLCLCLALLSPSLAHLCLHVSRRVSACLSDCLSRSLSLSLSLSFSLSLSLSLYLSHIHTSKLEVEAGLWTRMPATSSFVLGITLPPTLCQSRDVVLL